MLQCFCPFPELNEDRGIGSSECVAQIALQENYYCNPRKWKLVKVYIYIELHIYAEPPTCGQDHPYNLLQSFRIF